MNDKYLNEVMHAYAAGCLDREDLIPLLGSLGHDGKINSPDLGELQNLISLLPAILIIENPPATAKDNIAKKLYAIREEILANKIFEKDATFVDENTASQYIRRNEKIDSPDHSSASSTEERHSLRSESHEKDEIFKSERFTIEKPARQSIHRDNYDIPDIPVKKESKVTLIALIIIFLLLIAGATGAVYMLMQQKITGQEKAIAAVKTDITILNDEIIRLNKIQRILAILGSKDVSTINLDGTIDNPVGFGKIVFDPLNREGLLSLFNMPALPKEKTYQLWLLSKGQPFSLGTFNPVKDADRYIPIDEFPDIPLDNIDAFQLTLEEAQGSDSPKGTVYLASAVKKSGRASY